MNLPNIVLGAGLLSGIRQFVMATKLHPILVNFTAALVPVSVASDLAGRLTRKESFRATAWWTLLYATVITPFTAVAGWLFWMKDDSGVAGMTIHKWLGSSLVVLLFGLFAWRWRLHRRQLGPTTAYLIAGALVVALLMLQGYLGGQQVFSGM
jgi:uncharacterized membrane protein